MEPAKDSPSPLLPHEALHHLHEKRPASFEQRIFGAEGNTSELFWAQAAQTMPWLKLHPGWSCVQEDAKRCIPVRLHGDEVVYSKRGHKLMVCNMCSALTKSVPVALAIFLCFAVRSSFLLSYDPLMAVLAWSFGILLNGTMPSTDHCGNPLTGKRAKLAGSGVAGSFRFLFVQLVGDWQFSVETLQLDSNYSRDALCFLCGATKSAGPSCAWQYGTIPGWLNTLIDDATFKANRPDLVW